MLWRLKIVPQLKAGTSETVFNSPFSCQNRADGCNGKRQKSTQGKGGEKKKRGLKERLQVLLEVEGLENIAGISRGLEGRRGC